MIIISIDVETPSKANKCQLNDVARLIEVLDRHGAGATYFFSIFELLRFPGGCYDAIKMLQGRDVQLHVHPKYRTGKSDKMSDYTLEQQISIIHDAKYSMIRHFPMPVAIRAGGYHANKNTLEAAVRNRIHIDSSFWQGLIYPALWEIPIDTYYRSKFGFKLKRKVDIDWTTLDELEYLYSLRKYIHVMGHSYSDPKKLNDFVGRIDVSDLSTFREIDAWRCDMPEADLSLQSYVRLLHSQANHRAAASC